MPRRAEELKRLAALETDDHVLWPYDCGPDGYGRVLFDGRMIKTHRLALIHRMPPANGRLACHKPGLNCPRNCLNYRHLYWGTDAQNQADRLIDGTSNRGERCGTHVLTEADVREIRRLRATTSLSLRKIAERYNIGSVTVWRAATRDTWAWLE